MIRFLTITMRNFLSVGAVTQAVRLDEPGLTLILGQNLDADSANSRNGVGKTTILQALCYALYGQPITKVRLDNLVNAVNQKNMLVTLDFEENGRRHRIERGRKPNIFRWTVDGRDRGEGTTDESQGENKHTQAEIERLIGMGLTLFRHLAALSTYTDPFLRLKAAEQREVIEELLGLTQVSERAEALKKQVSATKEAIRVTEAEHKATHDANARIEAAVRRAEQEQQSWLDARTREIGIFKQRIAALPVVDYAEAERAFADLEMWVATAHDLRTQAEGREAEADKMETEAANKAAEAERLRSTQDAETRTLAKRIRTELTGLEGRGVQRTPPQVFRLREEAVRKSQEAERRRMKATAKADEAAAVEAEMANPDGHTCTTCGQGLLGTDHLASVMAKLETKLEALAAEAGAELEAAEAADAAAAQALAEADEVEANAKTLWVQEEARVEALREELAKTEALTEEREARSAAAAETMDERAASCVEVADGLRTEAAALREKIKALGPQPKPPFATREAMMQAQRQRETLEASLSAEEKRLAEDDPHTGQIASLRSTLVDIDYGPLNDLTSLQRHQDFLQKLLTGRDSFLRKRLIDRNLMALNKRLNHYLEGLNLPHEVRFLPDLTVEIMLRGREYDFEQLSRGEQCRVSLATSFAFRDLHEAMNKPLNLLFADEVIDSGLDEAGGEAALDLLRKMSFERGRAVFLVTHRETLVGKASRLLLVRKTDGFTVIETEGIEVELKEAA